MKVSVKKKFNMPHIYVDDNPVFFMGFKENSTGSGYADFAAQGYNCFVSNIDLNDIWSETGSLSFATLKSNLEQIKNVKTKTFIILEIHANPPLWWEKNNPEELMCLQDGQKTGQSMASQKWLEETGDVVASLVKHCEKRYGDSIIAYFVGAGHTWEWFYRTLRRYGVDYSQPMAESFNSWLRKEYKTVELLRDAWKDNSVNFGQSNIPTKKMESEADSFSFRDPSKRRRVIDFYEFYNLLIVEKIEYFAKVVKKASCNQKLFGAFYGHILEWLGNPATAQHSGHLLATQLLQSPNVNIIAGPNCYSHREIGGDASCVGVPASWHNSGKIWFVENDSRTMLAERLQDFCGRPSNYADTEAILKRDFAKSLLSTNAMVWFSLFKDWYNDARLMSLMGAFQTIAEKALPYNRSSVAEIVLVVDERSSFYQTARDTYRVDTFISREARMYDILNHIGAPFDVIYADDLLNPENKKYKLYIFQNLFYADKKMRSAIAALKAENRVLLWLYAPGYVSEDGLSLDNMYELTGMNFAMETFAHEAIIKITDTGTPLTSGKLNFGIVLPTWIFMDYEGHFGSNHPIAPVFNLIDSDVFKIGEYTATGKCGFGLKDNLTWTSIFVGTSFLPAVIVRKAAKLAGAHIYNDNDEYEFKKNNEMSDAGWSNKLPYNFSDDILYASKDFLALHCKFKGPRRIVLPEKTDVIEIFTETLIAQGQSEFILEAKEASTYLFYIGNKKW